MKKLVLLSFLTFISTFLLGQSIERAIFTPAGEIQTISGSAIISWSIGEPISENYISTNHITQGFQQGKYSVVLPVHLFDFEATRQNTSTVQLNWKAAWTGGFKGFWVERKLEHETEFTALEFIEKNSLESDLFYETLDENDYHNNSYYRLKMIKLDGSVEYSAIKVVAGSPLKHQITIFPNPTQQNITLSMLPDMRQSPERVRIVISNSVGQLIFEEAVNFSPEIQLSEIARLGKGIYLIQIYLDDVFFSTQRFAKI